ncbi:DUF4309 domain-containing protein [Paenibacillus psychroresistens]|uniref:DUF4309 domain-containing protein n=1 Tax=Paenibacillus psychroresistens TaxID=1778678 RepID=A0A6B8RT95_9BACL|nr:YjgB family protein [Paenibacillus psychroresistens]QGQ99139.1 DUF4309 domain-containing protein [Paenibacillus psychroresistens]
MKPQFKIIASSVLIASTMMLTACSSSSPAATTVPTATATPIASVSPSPTSIPTSSPTIAPKPIAVTPAPATATDAANKQIKALFELAKKGLIPDVKFAAHIGLFDEVEEAWGKADKTEGAGKGIYATYSKRNVVIGFNKGMKIFDVRSNAANLQKLTLKQIENALGKPNNTTVNGDDTIYIYKVNDQYQLKFIIPKSTGKVDHISVYSPQDTINNMAG